MLSYKDTLLLAIQKKISNNFVTTLEPEMGSILSFYPEDSN